MKMIGTDWVAEAAEEIYGGGDISQAEIVEIIKARCPFSPGVAYEPVRSGGDFGDVGRFHEKFGLPTASDGSPRELTYEELCFRFKFLCEELAEYAEAMGLKFEASVLHDSLPNGLVPEGQQDLPKAFDALLDLCYVALGTAHMHRFPWSDGWRRVQAANMAKRRASEAGDSKRGSALDVVKPEGWRPPNITESLMAAGWPGPQLPLVEGETD